MKLFSRSSLIALTTALALAFCHLTSNVVADEIAEPHIMENQEHLDIHFNKNVANLMDVIDSSDKLVLLYIFHSKITHDPNGQDWSLYTPPSVVHSERGSTFSYLSSPWQTNPIGQLSQRWSSSMIYWLLEHFKHVDVSGESFTFWYPLGQAVRMNCPSLLIFQSPTISPPSSGQTVGTADADTSLKAQDPSLQ